MVFKRTNQKVNLSILFENDVKMYSIQAESVQKGIKEKVGKYR